MVFKMNTCPFLKFPKYIRSNVFEQFSDKDSLNVCYINKSCHDMCSQSDFWLKTRTHNNMALFDYIKLTKPASVSIFKWYGQAINLYKLSPDVQLVYGVTENLFELVQYLIQQNSVTRDEMTFALMESVSQNNLDIVHLLIDNGATIDLDVLKKAILICNGPLFKYLLNKSTITNILPLLMMALKNQCLAIVDILMEPINYEKLLIYNIYYEHLYKIKNILPHVQISDDILKYAIEIGNIPIFDLLFNHSQYTFSRLYDIVTDMLESDQIIESKILSYLENKIKSNI